RRFVTSDALLRQSDTGQVQQQHHLLRFSGGERQLRAVGYRAIPPVYLAARREQVTPATGRDLGQRSWWLACLGLRQSRHQPADQSPRNNPQQPDERNGIGRPSSGRYRKQPVWPQFRLAERWRPVPAG